MHLKIAITLLLLKTINADIQAGNTCTLKSGEEGICKSIDQCDHGIKMVNTGIFPSLCGFNGTVAIICCRYTTVVSKQTREIPKKRGLGDITKKSCSRSPINKSSIQRIRTQSSKDRAEAIKSDFQNNLPETVTVYWDGKLSPGLDVRSSKEEHLPILISFGEKKQLLDMPKLESSSGQDQAKAVLTALYDWNLEDKLQIIMKPSYVAVGFTKKQNFEGQLLKVLEGIQHPDFSYPILYNDIGLLKVEKMKFNSFVRPACLNVDSHVNREHAIATGWGKVGSSSLSDDLLKVKLQLFNTTLCNSILGEIGRQLKDGISSETQICAGSMTDIKDTCNGDSGGPLQIFHNESLDGTKCMYDIIGITSFGKRCGVNVGNPGVYTRVSAYIKWIEETVWPEN
ncbi:unnamed protein product [Brassicogethes aeneus]|uniref:Uncharacterized protein n=1 Tax=Brassicogethes aeneus TaxID=1431903 RepID=A0A9P0FL81_BRAAE|nr:unnamed protein product [Brassicogethes aeneus]